MLNLLEFEWLPFRTSFNELITGTFKGHFKSPNIIVGKVNSRLIYEIDNFFGWSEAPTELCRNTAHIMYDVQ